ncbi:MAG: hypothetical protein CMJ25_18830 [Phycisphaerae bacterium]|nr:hypothetical protein [Phycisphaerae bacterium]|tara:strand:+ start:331 stop:690 length:360 start_codon:yes stop_codon:yes gene_type:complete
MAITYKWNINQMNAHIQAEGEDNVIYTVHWTYLGSEESGGQEYEANQIGVQSFQYKSGEPFIPYENTEAFENVVIGWLEGALDIPSMQSSIEAQIQKQITPINEDLYFTWQNPPIPPVE